MQRDTFSRRTFLEIGAALTSAIAGGGTACVFGPGGNDGRLQSRPGVGNGSLAAGMNRLDLAKGRDGFLYLPASYQPGAVTPLAVFFHGAGGNGGNVTANWRAICDEFGLAMLAPDSRDSTWDVIRGDFDQDVAFIDRALEFTFRRVSVDPARLFSAGFSDGASYSLSLGLTNGDLFRRVLAFSPGFTKFATRRGQPPVFVSHGTLDPVLPFDNASGRIVPQLEALGYDVTFRIFTGGHTVPAEVAREAFAWALPAG